VRPRGQPFCFRRRPHNLFNSPRASSLWYLNCSVPRFDPLHNSGNRRTRNLARAIVRISTRQTRGTAPHRIISSVLPGARTRRSLGDHCAVGITRLHKAAHDWRPSAHESTPRCLSLPRRGHHILPTGTVTPQQHLAPLQRLLYPLSPRHTLHSTPPMHSVRSQPSLLRARATPTRVTIPHLSRVLPHLAASRNATPAPLIGILLYRFLPTSRLFSLRDLGTVDKSGS
jgi:hypothetical protein